MWSRAFVALPVALVLSGCAGGSGVTYNSTTGGGGGGGTTNLNYTGSGAGVVTSLSGPDIHTFSDFSFSISVSN